MLILIMCTYFELCFLHEPDFQFSPPIQTQANNIQNEIQEAKQEAKQEVTLENVYNKPDVVEQNVDKKQVEYIMVDSLSALFIICLFLALIAYYFCYYWRGKKQQNQHAEIEPNAIQKQKEQSQNHSQEEQIQFIESSCKQSDGSKITQKWGEIKSKKKISIQSFKPSDNKIQNKESHIDQIQDAQKVIDSMNNDSSQEKVQENLQNADIIQIDDQKPQIDKPPQQQQDNGRTIQAQRQFGLKQKQDSNVEEIKQDEYNQFKQQIHKDEQYSLMQQEVQEQQADVDKEQQKSNVENQQNLILAYEILNEKFYVPSFKSRQIDDDELKKFVRSSKNVQQFQVEYNLDGSQEQLFSNEIQVFIPIRGDGNCLFTSIGFQYIFYNLIDDKRFDKLVGLIRKTGFKQIYKQIQSVNGQQRDIIISYLDNEQDILMRQSFLSLIKDIKFRVIEQKEKSVIEQQKEANEETLLKVLTDSINDSNGPFYGLLIIFMRNYFRQILQDFYDTNEMKFLIQNPDLINEINTWEHMYDETDIALKLFASKEQILIKCYQKMNVDDKTVNISEYKADDQQQFQYQIGLAFQPGHYNVLMLKY